MKRKLSYTIKSLLYNTDDLRGPIKQVLFAQNYFSQEGENSRVDRLCLVEFPGTNINKHFPEAQQLEETLLLGYSGWGKDSELHLVIRGERTYLTVAVGYGKSRKIKMRREYEKEILSDKLSEEEVHKIFTDVWNKPEIIDPLPPSLCTWD